MRLFKLVLIIFSLLGLFMIVTPSKAFANLSDEFFALSVYSGCNLNWINVGNTLGQNDSIYGTVTNHIPVCSWKFPPFNIPANSKVNKIIARVYNSPLGNSGVSSMSPTLGSIQTCVPPPFWPATLFNGIHEYDVTPQNCPQTFPTLDNLNSGYVGWVFLNSGNVNLQTDAISMQIDYTPPSVTPTPTPTPVSDFKQTDPQWSTLPSSPPNQLTRINHTLTCEDMYNIGCAVTATSDVLYSYGNTTLVDSATLDPGSLNNWLTNNNGFNSCSIAWANASTAVKIGAPHMNFRNKDTTWPKGQQEIDDALSNGDLPILGINTQYGTHFLAVSEKLPDVNGGPDYKLIDPAQYPFVQGNLGNTGLSLSQKYGGFDNVYETVIYKKGSTLQNSLTIRGHSPIQLLITDPNGKATGFDAGTQSIIEDIPNSAYGIEGGIAPVTGELPAQSETKYFQQINPSEGKYLVKIIGTGSGDYMIDLSKTDEQGNVTTQVINGNAEKNKLEEYSFEYTQIASEPIILEPVDITPPTTNIALYGEQGQDDWYRSNVNIVLSATDEENGSGVDKTFYRLNGSGWYTYSEQIGINNEGNFKIDYYSVDQAGNKEIMQSKSFHIDKTPPQISLSVDKSYLWPPNGKMVPVTVTSSFTDNNLWLKVINIQDEYSEITPLLTEGVNNISLKAYRRDNDMDGRNYTITASAQDKAGNASQKLENIIVLHDQRK